MAMVIEPQLTTTERFKKFHVNAREEINAARIVQNAQSFNLGAIAQSLSQSRDDTTITDNHLSGFIMFIEVVSYEGTGYPKNEELTDSNPILTISSGKGMVGSQALELTKYRIANPCCLGGSSLVPLPRPSKSGPEVLGIIFRMGRGSSTRGWQAQQLIESNKMHFMGVVKQPKVDIPSNFIKFVGKVNNQGTHKLPNKPFRDVTGMFGIHKNNVILVKHMGDRKVTSGRLGLASGGGGGLQMLLGGHGDERDEVEQSQKCPSIFQPKSTQITGKDT
ncbi:hypothetical protein Cgig2_028230 [Carnegiea gigantea]|uniref:Uncharacterized protein n=1 Tax=Carnegiea gigantea TaxID=171969 RepID=A0A9Q1QI29_9CARY|nr:hypothetical protein Cgig2_028230 [Carnegiea gigantea]